MDIQLDNNKTTLTVNTITILNGDIEFIIKLDKFGELTVNKQQYGEGEGSIIIRPKVSNEIGLA